MIRSILSTAIAVMAILIVGLCGLVMLLAAGLGQIDHPIFGLVWGASSLLTATLAATLLVTRPIDG
jgi:hypothetical protein